MINQNDRVKIVDFGLARKFVWPLKAKCGTPGYVAPEILFDGEVDGNSDIYSIGVSLYVMLTDQVPSQINFKRVLTPNHPDKTDVDHILT